VPIFFALNGLGLVFLLYVLVNFWKEGQRAKRAARHHAGAQESRNFEPIIVTHPISHTAQGGISIIPLRPLALAPGSGDSVLSSAAVNHRHAGVHHTVVEMPLRRISTNSAAENLPRRAKIAAKDGPRC
jgi:hypothetical protein